MWFTMSSTWRRMPPTASWLRWTAWSPVRAAEAVSEAIEATRCALSEILPRRGEQLVDGGRDLGHRARLLLGAGRLLPRGGLELGGGGLDVPHRAGDLPREGAPEQEREHGREHDAGDGEEHDHPDRVRTPASVDSRRRVSSTSR